VEHQAFPGLASGTSWIGKLLSGCVVDLVRNDSTEKRSGGTSKVPKEVVCAFHHTVVQSALAAQLLRSWLCAGAVSEDPNGA
jgi:hypothetical protein